MGHQLGMNKRKNKGQAFTKKALIRILKNMILKNRKFRTINFQNLKDCLKGA